MMMRLDNRYPELREQQDDPKTMRLIHDLERAYAPPPAPLSVRVALRQETHHIANEQPPRVDRGWQRSLPAWAQRRALLPALALLAAVAIGGAAYAAVVTLTNAPGDQIMLSQYRDAPPALQPIGRGHVLGRIQRNTVGFEYVAYALRHPKPGCMGFVSLPLTIEHGQWHDMGRGYGFTCLSSAHPVDFGYLSISGGAPATDLSVIYARTLPSVHALRFMTRRSSPHTVPVAHGFYLAFGSAANITKVQALDGHGRVLGQETVAATYSPIRPG